MTEEVKDGFIKKLEEREAFYKSQLTQHTESLKRTQEIVGVLNGGIQGIQEAKAIYAKMKEEEPKVLPNPDAPMTDEAK